MKIDGAILKNRRVFEGGSDTPPTAKPAFYGQSGSPSAAPAETVPEKAFADLTPQTEYTPQTFSLGLIAGSARPPDGGHGFREAGRIKYPEISGPAETPLADRTDSLSRHLALLEREARMLPQEM